MFASELKALVAAVGSELRIEPGALVASMLYYWVPEQRCSIEGVAQAPARHLGAVPPRRHAPRSSTYWRIADVAAAAAARPAADLRQVIEESVTAHLVADVPVSSFLSGGLDSSIVTVLAHRANPGVDAYTITFRPEDQRLEAMPDDAVYARKVARAVRHQAARDRDLARTSSTCCRGWSTSSTSRSATRRPSTRC